MRWVWALTGEGRWKRMKGANVEDATVTPHAALLIAATSQPVTSCHELVARQGGLPPCPVPVGQDADIPCAALSTPTPDNPPIPPALYLCGYYDLEELRRVFGRVDGYVKSPPGRYHDALQPGDLSQTGQVQARAGHSLNKHAAGCLLAVPDCRCRWAARLHGLAGWHHDLCMAWSSTVSRAHLTVAHPHLANGAHRPLPTRPRQVCELLLRSLVARRRYDPADFCSRLDALLDGLDGTPYGAGDYTDVAMRDVWRGRKVCGGGVAEQGGRVNSLA